MAETILTWAITSVGSIILTAIATYFTTKRSTEKKRTKVIEEGVQSLLRAEILDYYEKYLALGFCPAYAKEVLSKMYRAYHALGGNDVATDMYEAVMALPLKLENKTED